MPRRKSNVGESASKKVSHALSPQADENEMIALAMEQARKQLMEGTASSQIVVHYLKLASSKENLEQQIAEQQLELLKAKTDAIKSAKRSEELYAEAIKAMQEYNYNPTGGAVE